MIIHCWDAYDDLYEILKNKPVKKLGVIHSFIGGYKTANKFIVPFKGQRNEPLYVAYVAEKIAKIKQITPEKVAEITTQNTQKLFDLPVF